MTVISMDYLAGFYEGEGSPFCSSGFGLSAYQKERIVLDLICENYGGNVIPHFANDNECYAWQLYGKPAAKLAFELLNYMHSPYKIEQLTHALVLMRYLTPRSSEEEAEVDSHFNEVRVYNKSYHEEHIETKHAQDARNYQKRREKQLVERRDGRAFLRDHPEVVASLQPKLLELLKQEEEEKKLKRLK